MVTFAIKICHVGNGSFIISVESSPLVVFRLTNIFLSASRTSVGGDENDCNKWQDVRIFLKKMNPAGNLIFWLDFKSS